jgi:hypothetical protein
MWDITVSGDNDHDFYVLTVSTGVLVHNCGGLLDNIKQTANNIWTKWKPANTTRPGPQLGLGAAGGAISGAADSLQQRQRGWNILGDIALGAGTGAIGNLSGGSLLSSAGFGAAAGTLGSIGGDLVNTHRFSGWGDAKWALVGGGLGAAENSIKSGLSAGQNPDNPDPTTGNGWGVGMSGMQGELCGGMDSAEHWNC